LTTPRESELGGAAGRIVYVSLPASLGAALPASFNFDLDIPIPVELPAGSDVLKPEELTLEMILSAMLKLLGEDGVVEKNRGDYYRRFVLAARPRIQSELSAAALHKARAADFPLALEISRALRGLFPDSPASLLNEALILELRWKREGEGERDNEGADAVAEEVEEKYGELLRRYPAFPEGWFNAGFFYLSCRAFE